MKELEINDRKLQYKISLSDNRTDFFEGTIETNIREYIFFGKKIVRPKYLFSIWINIENKYYTKEEIRELIEAEFLIDKRIEEIKNGKVI